MQGVAQSNHGDVVGVILVIVDRVLKFAISEQRRLAILASVGYVRPNYGTIPIRFLAPSHGTLVADNVGTTSQRWGKPRGSHAEEWFRIAIGNLECVRRGIE